MGVLLAKAYMAQVEQRSFQIPDKLKIYAQFRDDSFENVNESTEIDQIATTLTSNSVLRLTIERSLNRRLPHLDVMISQKDDRFHTSVFFENTIVGRCLNARDECLENYKRSVVAAYAKRAITHTTAWDEIHTEMERVR